VVDGEPFTMQLSRDPSIAIAREFQTEAFNPPLESLFMILLGRRWLLRRVIEATSRRFMGETILTSWQTLNAIKIYFFPM